MLLTKSALRVKEEELAHLKTLLQETRLEKRLSFSQADGDGWHDNFGYEQATREEKMIIGRINALNEEIASATIINEDLNDDIKSVVVGSFVCLKLDYGNNDVESFAGKLVALSGDITQNEITINSAIGRSILTKKIGDVVQAILPNGEKVNIEILNVF